MSHPDIDAAVEAIRSHVMTVLRYGTRADREGVRDWNRRRREAGLSSLHEHFDLAGDRIARTGSLLTLAELHALPPVSWLVNGWIPEGCLVVLYGSAGVGKSFVTLGMVFCVSLGLAWLGHATVQGGALFVAGEGVGMLRERTSAWCRAHGVSESAVRDVYFCRGALNLLDPKAVTDFLDMVAGVDLRLIVFDTLARCMPGGDENSARDMGLAIGSLDRIRAATGAAVLAVHHTGKNRIDERGSSALRGAADTMIKVSRAANSGLITLKADKLKDGAEPTPLQVRLVRAGGSCIVKPAGVVAEGDIESAGGQGWSGSARNRDVLRALDRMGEGGATATEWQRAVHTRHGIGEKAFYQALSELWEQHLVANPQRRKRNSRYRVTECGLKALTVNPSLPVAESDDSELRSLPPLPPPSRGGGREKEGSESHKGLGPEWGTIDQGEEES